MKLVLLEILLVIGVILFWALTLPLAAFLPGTCWQARGRSVRVFFLLGS
jgi:hypothetical protein